LNKCNVQIANPSRLSGVESVATLRRTFSASGIAG